MLQKNRLAWNGIAVVLPAAWEVVAYQLDEDRGEFRLNEKLEPRGQITWQRYKKEIPELSRLIHDLHVRMCEQRLLGPEEPYVSDLAGWTVARGRPQVPRHAARWCAERRLVVRVIADPSASDDDFAALLMSWNPRSDGSTDHAIFGLRAVLPPKWEIEHLIARPGNVRLIASGPGMITLTTRRIALAKRFLNGHTPEDFFSRLLRAENSAVLHSESLIIRGSAGAKIIFRRPGEHRMEKVLGAFWKGTGYLWHDERTNRLHSVEQIGPKRTKHQELDHVVPPEDS